MNNCLEEGCIPKQWRECLLTIIPKGKGDPGVPASWRGIALRNVMSKPLSALIAARLERHLETEHVIPDEKYGFRRERSTYAAGLPADLK